jgi:ankyrin repeat protein
VIKKILLIGGICVALAFGAVVWFFVAVYMSMERGEKHQRQLREEQRSGKWDFGDQPALFAVAQAIVKNDQDAIRVAAKALPDMQAPGRDGTTLLYFAVTQSWQSPELVEAVRTLLSLGADPNYTNGKPNSFAMANAVHASAPVLRAMLEAGGNPNTRDEFGGPMILMNWYLGYYPDQARSRFDLLLDHGADINSAMPRMDRILPVIRCCFTARKWDSTTSSLLRMR